MNPTLNLSTFKVFENRVAAEFLKLKQKNRAALIYMEVRPDYPGDISSIPAHFRPLTIVANAKVITLKENVSHLEAEEVLITDNFSNPGAVVTSININSADLTALRHAFRGEFADVIFRERQRAGRYVDENDFAWRIATQINLDSGQVTRIESMLMSREDIIVF
jgi:hypothetical protein